MKKLISFLVFVFCTISIYSQTHNSVALNDSVYEVLASSAEKGYCSVLYNLKPYSESYILAKLEEISEFLEDKIEDGVFENDYNKKILETELNVIKTQKNRFIHENGLNLKQLTYRIEEDMDGVPFTLELSNKGDVFVSGGLYNPSENNSAGYEVYDTLDIKGDISKHLSYDFKGYIGLTYMPIKLRGDKYYTGSWWYDSTDCTDPNYGKERWISTYRNYSVLPYSYNKFWDGNIWYLTNMNAGGLEGWPIEHSLAFGMNGELRSSFFDNRIEISMSRNTREWAAMDEGSSLVLNGNARPMLAFEASVHPLSWLGFSTLTGITEFANQAYINENHFSSGEDSAFYQSAYSLQMLDIDFKYMHFDFGSGVVWPKRFELGYLFPMIDNVIMQDTLGDFDNLCLFGDLMFRHPGYGKVWISGYLDEMKDFKLQNLFKKTRYMFALQGGTQIEIPWLPFANISFRYTKIEPYCYTHNSINYTPWYEGYLAVSYTNNGQGIGYYLQPNSDEFHVRFETRPLDSLLCSIQYQLIRHGADFGDGQVPGSNYYSELQNQERDSLDKNFLKDGTYEWSNIISAGVNYSLRNKGIPIDLNMNCGYVLEYFTKPSASKTGYEKYETNEYKNNSGFVMSLGVTVFGK